MILGAVSFSEFASNAFNSEGRVLDLHQQGLCQKLEVYSEVLSDNQNKSMLAKWLSPSRHKNSPKGMYIYGDVGRGKTVILNLFFDFLQNGGKLREHFHKFMHHVHAELAELGNNNHPNPMSEVVRRYSQNYKVIILDEVQVNNIADAMVVGRLFKLLIENGVLVFMCSNRHPDELFKDGLQRDRFLPFIHFISSNLDLYNLTGSLDYRLSNFSGKQYFFYPNNETNTKKIRTILHTLTGHDELVERELEIAKNHNLLVHKCWGKVAKFSFRELCEVDLGSIDYLGLCNNFSVIAIVNIPKLSLEKHNEALRFITLIDCLYDRKIKLLCTLECPIDELYPQGKHAFEFQRTISRLKEMQTEKYFHSPIKDVESSNSVVNI